MIRPQRVNPILRRTSEIMPVRELGEHDTEIAETVQDHGRARRVEFGGGIGFPPSGLDLYSRMLTLGRSAMKLPNKWKISLLLAALFLGGTIVALRRSDQAEPSRMWPFAAPPLSISLLSN